MVRFIYTLSNPITQETFYVGCTENIKTRRKMHVKKFSDQFNGKPPVFTVIDFIEGSGCWPGLALERYWINKYKSEGAQLINRYEMKSPCFQMEYKKYRSELRKSTVLDYRTIPNRA